jgi:uncharacterized protein (TIGR03437 family)
MQSETLGFAPAHSINQKEIRQIMLYTIFPNVLRCLLGILLLLAPIKGAAQSQSDWMEVALPFPANKLILEIYDDGRQLLVPAAGPFGADALARIHRSTDGGRTWEPNAYSVANLVSVNSIVSVDGVLLAGGSGAGKVSRSEDGGRSWANADTGMELPAPEGSQVMHGEVRKLTVSGNTVLFSLKQGSETALFVSRDTARNWSLVQKRAISDPVALEGGVIFTATDLGGVKLFRLDNNAQTPSPIETAPDGLFHGAPRLFGAGGTLFLFGGTTPRMTTALYRSTDGGRNWSVSDAGIFDTYSGRAIEIKAVFAGGGNLFALGEAECGSLPLIPSLYLSRNDGVTWTKVSYPIPLSSCSYTTSLSVSEESIFVASTSSSSGNKLHRRANVFAPASAPAFTTASAASFRQYDTARGSIVAGFGSNLAPELKTATTLPLPTTLAGVRVKLRDSAGTERAAPLFFVSPSQINYLVPEDLSTGAATVTVTLNDNPIAEGQMNIVQTAPALFSANADGQGLAAAIALRINVSGTQSYDPASRLENGKRVPNPIDLGLGDVYLLLFGSGFRSNTGNVRLTIGGVEIPKLFAGAAPGFAGLDQVNAGPLPRSLAGRGLVDVVLTVDGRVANVLQIFIK